MPNSTPLVLWLPATVSVSFMPLLQRCHTVILEPRSDHVLDLASVLAGEAGLRPVVRWILRTAERDGEYEISHSAVNALGALTHFEPQYRERLVALFGEDPVAELERCGALRPPATGGNTDLLDDWHPLAAITHRHLRWRGVDSEAATERLQAQGERILDSLGPAPPMVGERPDALARHVLPRCKSSSPLESLVGGRVTGRNFDVGQPLPLDTLSELLLRTYGARAVSHTSGVPVMKRAVASAGGLHAIEAYVLVRSVDGLAPGYYHYHPIEHALDALMVLDAAAARAAAARFVAHQAWFTDAPALVVLVARFARNFWKYRRHAKTVRALILDAGHLSHHQYLVATELGLGAFITAAINEGDIEDAFGLDPMQEGVLAVTGFGYRGARMDVLEFDPLQKVWPEWQPE